MDQNRRRQKDATFYRIAEELGLLTRCKGRKVGAILVPTDYSQIVAIGYNGPARGRPDDACRRPTDPCGCAHAEQNCIGKARDAAHVNLTMFVTLAPCWRCATSIINAGCVSRVVYGRVIGETGLDLLKECGIETISIEKALA